MIVIRNQEICNLVDFVEIFLMMEYLYSLKNVTQTYINGSPMIVLKNISDLILINHFYIYISSHSFYFLYIWKLSSNDRWIIIHTLCMVTCCQTYNYDDMKAWTIRHNWINCEGHNLFLQHLVKKLNIEALIAIGTTKSLLP